MKICPKCNSEVEPNFELCWNCNYSFTENEIVDIKEYTLGDREIDCLRCQIPMIFSGKFEFHEGFSSGVYGAVFEAFQNKEPFDIYLCPKCGKTEFFTPKNNTDYKPE